MQSDGANTVRSKSNRRVVLVCSAVVVSMAALSYAAVPLYRIFCQVTGYGGTTQVATEAPASVLERTITVRFDANASRDMGWDFRPAQNAITLKVGENALAFYRATNLTQKETVGTATFNVTPLAAGQYFNKVDCFCFTEQRLAAGKSVDMPVSFFVDPAINDDPDLVKLKTITLSYTFFPVEEEEVEDATKTSSVKTETDQGS